MEWEGLAQRIADFLEREEIVYPFTTADRKVISQRPHQVFAHE